MFRKKEIAKGITGLRSVQPLSRKVLAVCTRDGFYMVVRQNASVELEEEESVVLSKVFKRTGLCCVVSDTREVAGSEKQVEGLPLLVCDEKSHQIIVVTVNKQAAHVEVIAGCGSRGWKDGKCGIAHFNSPKSICVVAETILVCDTGNHAIRTISNGTVSTLAGGRRSLNGGMEHGFRDGNASEALFDQPICITASEEYGEVFICDQRNNCLRQISGGMSRETATVRTISEELNGIRAMAIDHEKHILYAGCLDSIVRILRKDAHNYLKMDVISIGQVLSLSCPTTDRLYLCCDPGILLALLLGLNTPPEEPAQSSSTADETVGSLCNNEELDNISTRTKVNQSRAFMKNSEEDVLTPALLHHPYFKNLAKQRR